MGKALSLVHALRRARTSSILLRTLASAPRLAWAAMVVTVHGTGSNPVVLSLVVIILIRVMERLATHTAWPHAPTTCLPQQSTQRAQVRAHLQGAQAHVQKVAMARVTLPTKCVQPLPTASGERIR